MYNYKDLKFNSKVLELKDRFGELIESISLHELGNHPEYDNYDFDELVDELHSKVLSEISDYVYRFMEILEKHGTKIYNLKSYLAYKKNISCLYYLAWRLYEIGYGHVDFENSYGNGVIDSIGADFAFPQTYEFEFFDYDYDSAYAYLDKYGLIDF